MSFQIFRSDKEKPSGELIATKKGGTDVLGSLSEYELFFNKRANYLALKNAKGREFVCSDDPDDSNIR
ncbi:MAG: hypothetical protein SGJ18_10480 [Pseudomonadota bacterium]|nr:hypothetical protein [Pseudomonadota bacterium]